MIRALAVLTAAGLAAIAVMAWLIARERFEWTGYPEQEWADAELGW